MPFFSGLELDHFSDRLHVIEPGILLRLSFERRSANKITIVDLYCFSLAKPIGSLLITAHLPLLLMYTSSWSSVSIVTRASNRSRKGVARDYPDPIRRGVENPSADLASHPPPLPGRARSRD